MPKSWTDDAPTPVVLQDHAHLKDSFFYTLKRRLLGNPLNRHSLGHQRLSKRYAYGILSSDCIEATGSPIPLTFFTKLKADIYRYMAEVCHGTEA